jgi:hypothetical protein
MRAVSPSLVRTVVAVSAAGAAPHPEHARLGERDGERDEPVHQCLACLGDNAPTSLPSMLDMSR